MERLKSTAVIFLFAVGLFTSAAPAKPASVLLQEGLYAEEIEGDLDAAIKIYEQVIAGVKEAQQAAAQATYRIGMCYLKKGEQAKAANQFSNLVSRFPEQKHIVDKALKQLAKLTPPAIVFEPQALDELIKSGKVPAFKTQIYDNTGLDLETGVSVPFMDEWPALCDVAWDNDGGGALMIKPKSSVRFIALGAAENWEDAISMARNSLDALRTSTSKGMFASQSKFAAVLTSEGNLAVIQIGEYDANKGMIYGCVEKIPAWIRSFGPVIERVINDNGEEKDWLIDFEAGRLFSPSTETRSNEAFSRWIVENRIDAMGETRTSSPGLYGFEMAVIPIAAEGWETISPKGLADALSIVNGGVRAVISAKGKLPVTYIFKTREGGMGVVQILEMQYKEKPRYFRIRYKMVQEQELMPSLKFGSATEFESKKTIWIDFDSHSGYLGTAARGKKSVDVKINLGRDVVYLEGKGTTFALIAGQEWDDLTPYEVWHALAQSQHEESLVVRQYPTNYAFQTREGRMGLIQVWGPFPARILYKMLQEPEKTAPVEVELDLSTPEATVISFTKSAVDGNVELAMACFAPDSHDYGDVKELLTSPAKNFFKTLFEAVDPNAPIAAYTYKQKKEGDWCEINWKMKLKKGFKVEGQTFKAGETFELDGNLKKVEDRWLIVGI